MDVERRLCANGDSSENGGDDESIKELWIKMRDIISKTAKEDIPVRSHKKGSYLSAEALEIATKRKRERKKRTTRKNGGG